MIADPQTYQEENYYVQDVEFPSGYVVHQSPIRLSCVAAVGGFSPPDPKEPFTYMDLGCGNGTTLNTLAAANPHAMFLGVDFNHQHIEEARGFAEQAGLKNARYIESDFRELPNLGLSSAQYVAMNGIYSWLHPEVIASVLEFLRSTLAEGGLFYVQNMTMPGKASIAPVWHLVRELSRGLEDPFERVDYGLGYLEQLLHNEAAYFKKHPPAAALVKKFASERKLGSTSKNLVHHALSDSWRPLYFTDLVKEMKQAGLVYAASSNFQQNDPMLCLPPLLQNSLSGMEDAILRELVKDFMLNTHNRFDVFVKGRPDQARAGEFLSKRVYFLRRRLEPLSRLGISKAGRRMELPVGGTPYEHILSAPNAGPMNLGEGNAGANIETNGDLLRHANRLLATNACFICTSREIQRAEPSDSRRIAHKANALILERAVNHWRRVELFSELTGEASIPLRPLEALVLKALCAASVKDPVVYVGDFLEKESLTSGPGPSPASDEIPENKLESVVQGMINGDKMTNLVRLGILIP